MDRPWIKRDCSRARTLIPGGVNSPVRAFKAVGGTPRFVQRAQGAYFWDANGKRHIDYIGSWGPMILGHGHPAVVEAVQKAVLEGLLVRRADRARSGTGRGDRGTRALHGHGAPGELGHRGGDERDPAGPRRTGRSKLIKFEGCYHGHADALLVKAGSGLATFGNPTSAGVPAEVVQDTLVLEYNNVAQLEEAFALYGSGHRLPDDRADRRQHELRARQRALHAALPRAVHPARRAAGVR
jgi:glutamate-1-semialdehyde 2,1-aminomutase